MREGLAPMGAEPRSLGPPAAPASTTCHACGGTAWRLGKRPSDEVLAVRISAAELLRPESAEVRQCSTTQQHQWPCARGSAPKGHHQVGTHIEGRRGDAGTHGDVPPAAVRLPRVLAGVCALVGGVALQHERTAAGLSTLHGVGAHPGTPRRSMRRGTELSPDCGHSRAAATCCNTQESSVAHQQRGRKGSLTSAGEGMMAPAGINVAVLAEALPGPAAMTFWTSKYLRTPPARGEPAIARVGSC